MGRKGGSYIIDADGSETLAEPATVSHPDGDRARTDDGRPLTMLGEPEPLPSASDPSRTGGSRRLSKSSTPDIPSDALAPDIQE